MRRDSTSETTATGTSPPVGVPDPSVAKRVLILTYYFPPIAGPGSIRMVKFARYLKEFGWEPVVVTAKPSGSAMEDFSLLKYLPEGLPVMRTALLEPHRLYGRLTGRGDRALSRGHLSAPASSWKDRVLRWIRLNLFLPDARIGWIPFAYRNASRLLKETPFDCVLTSSPPHSLQMTGWLLKKRHDLPWVADVRDPWSTIEYYRGTRRSRAAQAADRWMERRFLSAADHLVTTSGDLVSTLCELGVASSRDSVTVIPNGVDALQTAAGSLPKPDRFRITHVGSLPVSRKPTTFLAGLLLAIDRCPKLRDDLELLFVGTVDDEIRRDLRSAGLDESTRFLGTVSHEEAVRSLSRSVLLLLPLPRSEGPVDIVPAKLFEYMASGRPILAYAHPRDEAHRILEEWCGHGAIPDGGIEETAARILGTYEVYEEGRVDRMPDIPVRYHRRELTRELARILDHTVAKAGSKSERARLLCVGRG